MQTPAELERYLHELEKALAGIATSERAEIVTEIKSHVMESLSRDPSQNIDALLHSLGEPTQAANRYLLERGIQPKKPPRASHAILKWLTIGFLGTFAIIVLGVVLVISKFSPIMKIDEKAGRVTFLGGLIDIAEKDGRTHIKTADGELEVGGREFSGNRQLSNAQKLVQLPFSNGQMHISMAEPGSKKIEWKCQLRRPTDRDQPNAQMAKDRFVLDLQRTSGVTCAVAVPEGVRVETKGWNGKISLEEPRFSGSAQLANGEIIFEADSAATYNVEARVANGVVDPMPNDPSPESFKFEFTVQNGRIHAN